MAFNLTPEITFLIGLVVFWAVLYILAYLLHLDKHGLDVKPAYFMFKSKALNSSLEKLAKKQPALWTVLSNIGLALSFGLMAYGIYIFANNILRFVRLGDVAYLVPAPIIPGVTLSMYWLPFVIFAIIVVGLPHELAHGIGAQLGNIPILSSGFYAVLVFFGAFVEQDEKEFEKSSLLARLRMLSAGSAVNLITALLAFLLLMGLFAAPAGTMIYDVRPNTPLFRSGASLQRWDVIQAINGTSVSTYGQYTNYMRNVGPNVTVTLTILHANRRENITLVTVPNPSNSSKGIVGFEVWFVPDYYPNRVGLDQYAGVNLYWTIFWTHILALSVAIFNMLPLYPFDGERVLYYPLERLMKKRRRELRIALNGFTLGLIALNAILSLWMYGLLRF